VGREPGIEVGKPAVFAKVVAKLQYDVTCDVNNIGVFGVTCDWPLNFGDFFNYLRKLFLVDCYKIDSF